MQPMVVLPSYNGARKLPNLTALLALLLAQDGVPVLVHGPSRDPGRVTTAEIFHDLGLPIAHDASDIPHAWARHEPVFIATETLCPSLARLLDARWVIGLRNPGHTVAKLMDPTRGGAALRVVNYTHPEYGKALTTFLQHSAANAMLMRGTEGEPVADPRRLPKLEVFMHGTPRPDLSLAAQEGVLTELPVLPRTTDAATTALYIQSVVSGEKPAPAPLTLQVDCIRRALLAWTETPKAEMSA
jgi:anthranilate phosphoribosyltransferase